MKAVVVAVLMALAVTPALAIGAGEALDDAALEARARSLGKELRCLVCQNQSIDDSNAELARDLRRLVRERILAGDSDAAIKDYLVARYGDFILLKPPFKATTYALWLGPAVILLFGGIAAVMYLRRQTRWPQTVTPLSAAERERLDELLDEN